MRKLRVRRGEPLGRRAHLAAAVRRRERRRIDAEAEDGTRTEAEASAEADTVSRRLVDAPRTWPAWRPRVAACSGRWSDHRRFELTACCAACERYVLLDLAGLVRFGWEALLDALRRRLACRRCGGRTGSVLIGYAGTGTGRNATDGRLQGGEDE